mmetsp:Transcript_45512/g.99122  ORF Transcript_45512/g.99122 Transcript_45512/m.99122 type:complete len:350 (-) Transcript_45512:281-1330(-)
MVTGSLQFETLALMPMRNSKRIRLHHGAEIMQSKCFKTGLQPVRTAPSLQKERHGRLVSTGARGPLSFLNGNWQRCPDQPDVAGKPHYILLDTYYNGTLHLTYCWKTCSWQVSSDLSASPEYIFAVATSDALHPNTVEKSSWKVLSTLGGFATCASFDVNCVGPNTPEKPFLIEELGRDFFVCAQPKKMIIWFECPSTGQTFHSGAKSFGGYRAGNRYCYLCNSCFSANNFKSQHLRSHTTPIAKKKLGRPPSASASRLPVKIHGKCEGHNGFCTLPPLSTCAPETPDDTNKLADESSDMLFSIHDIALYARDAFLETSDLAPDSGKSILDETDLMQIRKLHMQLVPMF